MLNNLPMPPADALHGVMAKYAADTRSEKMDLGVGIYRDETGHSPIMEAVLLAEKAHIAEQETKAYMGLRGDPAFLSGMQNLAFGSAYSDRIASIQTVGGTGGIYLAIKLAATANPDLTVHIGTPTWPVHFTICEAISVKTKSFPYFDKETQSLQYETLCETVSAAKAGDVLVLHGPCHNPTGQDLTAEQFNHVISLCNTNGVIPLIDAAYYGLGAELEDDLARLTSVLDAVPHAFIIMSCSKAFGLYRERTGVLFVKSQSAGESLIVQKTLEKIARNTYSMPPAHGGAVVGRILSDPDLTANWKTELKSMQARILGVRAELIEASAGDPRLAAVASQKGIFSLLPISSEVVDKMAVDHAIYMPGSGRINIAGFKTGDAERFCAALAAL